jgi:hypothetical protein
VCMVEGIELTDSSMMNSLLEAVFKMLWNLSFGTLCWDNISKPHKLLMFTRSVNMFHGMFGKVSVPIPKLYLVPRLSLHRVHF